MQVQKKRLLQATAVGAVAALALAACGGDSGGSAGSVPDVPVYAGPVGDGEGQVNILAWPGYVENGSTDPAVDWVTGFEQETGCKVNVKTFGTSDEAVKLMQEGGWDVVSASGDASLRLIYGGNVQPVDTALVPNYADVFADLKDQPFNSINGQMYGIPHGRGANLVVTNTDKVGETDSWSVMFDPNSPAKGGVTPYDSPIYIADAAVYLMATQPELGITYPYALDQTQFDAAIALLKQQKDLVSEYWSDYTKQIDAFKAGTSTAGTTWQVIVNLLDAEKAPIKATKAKEGATGWSDTWMIAKDTPNINCAYKWVNHIVSPEANAAVAEWFGEAPANEKSCALTANKDHCNVFHAGDTDYWKNVYYWNTPTQACLDGRTDVQCVPYAEWSKAWSELRS